MKALAILTALVLATACTTANATGGAVELRTLDSGVYAIATTRTAVVASDEQAYRRHWSELIGEGEGPAVDFATESVVIIVGDQQRTGGYEMKVRGATRDGDTLLLDAVIDGPPARAIVTQALTQPWAVVAVKGRGFTDVRW